MAGRQAKMITPGMLKRMLGLRAQIEVPTT